MIVIGLTSTWVCCTVRKQLSLHQMVAAVAVSYLASEVS